MSGNIHAVRPNSNAMTRNLLLAALFVATPAMAFGHETPDAQLNKILAGRVPGKPTNCISLSDTQSSQVVDHKAIVYRAGGRLYVNVPRSGAESLDDDDILVTRTIGSQLCSIDTVNLIDRGSRFPRGFVVLGEFMPYDKPKTPK